jgi:hypothetical protein
MNSRPAIVLAAVLRGFKPLARLLLRHGVAYPAFASALKQVFLEAALQELRAAGKNQTDSAISVLSGVHRRDVRNLGRLAPERIAMEEPMNMASQVVSRWVTALDYLDDEGQPRALPRSGAVPSFDSLVSSISSDIRPRTVLDELLRLGMVHEGEDGVRLLAPGFVPRQGFSEMAALLADNLHDHAAAASLNVEDGHNYLEQALFVDELTAKSVQHLHAVAARAWRQAFRTVMKEAQARFDHDQANAPAAQRIHRARFGGYYYTCDHHEQAS